MPSSARKLDDFSARKASPEHRRERLTEVIEELRRRERALAEILAEGLADFIPRVSPSRLRPDHLAPIVEVFGRIARGERVRVCISVPPQHGKTDLVQHALPWLLRRRPTWSTIYATYAQEQSDDKSHGTREIARRSGLSLSPDRQNLRQWRTTDGGGCLFTSVDGPGTGQPARVAIVDDPYKDRNDALSAATRARVARWFSSVILQRGQEGMSVVVIHTRWLEDDLIGQISAGAFGRVSQAPGDGGWEIINLPMLADADGSPSMPPFNTARRVLNPQRVTGTGDPFGWTLEGAIAQLLGMPEADALSINQGRPRKRVDGALWKWDWITPHRVARHPDLTRLVIGVDPSAAAGASSAETGIVAVGVGHDARGQRRAYVVADRSGRYPDASWDEAVVKLYDELDADAVVVEVNNGGDALAKIIRTAAEAMHRRGERPTPQIVVRIVRATRGKATRAEPAASLYQRGFVSHVGSLGDLEREQTTWDPATTKPEDSPGRVDALVWALDDLALIRANSGTVTTGRIAGL